MHGKKFSRQETPWFSAVDFISRKTQVGTGNNQPIQSAFFAAFDLVKLARDLPHTTDFPPNGGLVRRFPENFREI